MVEILQSIALTSLVFVLLVFLGCTPQPSPALIAQPDQYYFSVDSDFATTARFAYRFERASGDAANRQRAIKQDRGQRSNRQGNGERRNQQSNEKGAAIKEQFLAQLDSELQQRGLCQYGYIVLDLTQYRNGLNVIAECKNEDFES